MKDKQEDGGFSLVVLSISVVLYITITCMAFASMVVTRPTVGVAFLDFTKEYGALIAGIPVLIAVLVAKQQLDANRRQHVATVKRSFRDELEAIDEVRSLTKSINNSSFDAFFRDQANGDNPANLWILSKEDLEPIKKHLSLRIYFHCEGIGNMIVKLIEDSNSPHANDNSLRRYFKLIKMRSSFLDTIVDDRYRSCEKYWS